MMNADEMIVYFEKRLDKNFSEIEKELDFFSKEELYAFTNEILEKHYRYKINEILLILIRKLYDDSEEFVDLLCRVLEDAELFQLNILESEIIMSLVTERTDIAFNFVRSMVNMGNKKGISAGILLSMIYDRMEETEIFFSQGLESKNENLQRCSLVCLIRIINNGSYNTDKYINILKKVAPEILDKNEDHLIFCLQLAFNKKPETFLQLLESEIERRGSSAARNYITMVNIRYDNSISIVKKAIEILESNGCEETDESCYEIDMGLAEVYRSDPDFVIKRFKDRLHRKYIFELMDAYHMSEIKKIGSNPIVELVESEIDAGNQIPIHIINNIFSYEEWISWCEKWKDDKNKEFIIIKSLQFILNELYNCKSNNVRDRVIGLVKQFANKNSLNFAEITKGIDLGAYRKEGYENKESALKALVVLDQILNKIVDPPIEIDVCGLKKNLNKAPNLCAAFGYDWLIEDAKTSDPHVINQIFAHNSPYQSYIENAFSVLRKYGIEINKNKLRQETKKTKKNKQRQRNGNDENILAEVEVISKLAPYFEITLEPEVSALKGENKGKKKGTNLDLMIEHNGNKALIEIAVVNEKLERKLGCEPIFIPGEKVKKALLYKFNKQLLKGEADLDIPVILLLNLKGFHLDDDVKNGLYGRSQLSTIQSIDANHVDAKFFTREGNGFYHVENSEIVTAIGVYKFIFDGEYKFVGKLYLPIKYPKCEMEQNFRLRLRNALFGDSETSNWKTLMMIPGIDENLAKLLYSNGIEDIDILIAVNEDQICIKGMSSAEISKFRSEARRIACALSTHRINFLNSIDAEDVKILHKEGIYLIDQLLGEEKIPIGINESKWNLLVEDAKRIIL
jgi:hypothetical protein